MPYQLFDLELDELSLVTEPANQFAHVLLTKQKVTKADVEELARHNRVLDAELTKFRDLLELVKTPVPTPTTPSAYETLEEQMDGAEITKTLSEDIAKGQVSVLKADVERLAKSRADEIWKARGCPPGAEVGTLREAWATCLDRWAPLSSENPTLRAIYDVAPATHEMSKAARDLEADVAAADAELESLIAKEAKAHPDWSRLQCLNAAYESDRGTRIWDKRLVAARKLQKARGA
jgi:hypothetical protein